MEAKALTQALAGPKVEVVEANSGRFARLVRRQDGTTLAWAVFLKGARGVRLDVHGDIAAAPAHVREGTWAGSGKRPQLRVDELTVEHGKALIAFLVENVPLRERISTKVPAAVRKPAARKSSSPAKPKSPAPKRELRAARKGGRS